ncbi:unnamed protein product [Penicillium salamii]|nr:unnamed protein product [Penicillium salamii]CAG8244023.1 unnamed protein product [Penicillium salamii]
MIPFYRPAPRLILDTLSTVTPYFINKLMDVVLECRFNDRLPVFSSAPTCSAAQLSISTQDPTLAAQPQQGCSCFGWTLVTLGAPPHCSDVTSQSKRIQHDGIVALPAVDIEVENREPCPRHQLSLDR